VILAVYRKQNIFINGTGYRLASKLICRRSITSGVWSRFDARHLRVDPPPEQAMLLLDPGRPRAV